MHESTAQGIAPGLGVEVRRDFRPVVVRVVGEVDLANASALRWVLVDLIADGENQLTVDLEEVSFIDLCGLRVLRRIGRHLTEHDGSLLLHRPSRAVTRIIGLVEPDWAPLPWHTEAWTSGPKSSGAFVAAHLQRSELAWTRPVETPRACGLAARQCRQHSTPAMRADRSGRQM